MITLTVLIAAIALGIGAWKAARWSWTNAHQGGIWSLGYPLALAAFALTLMCHLTAAFMALNLAFIVLMGI